MTIRLRSYDRDLDFDRVGRFLISYYLPDNRDGNWIQPAWEYMHHHPLLNSEELHRIGLWENDGEIVAVTHYEWRLGEAFFQLHPDYGHLRHEMLAHAEANFPGETKNGRRELRAYINDFDSAFEAITLEQGFRPEPGNTRPMSIYRIPRPFPEIALPEGFRLKSLANENDLAKMNRVLWRGFNHEGEPSPEDIEGRKIMQSGPNFRHDLTMVVEAPDGHWVSYCGLWYEPLNRFCYVEPMATDPDYRQMGLGKAAMMEGIRRCAAEGATVAYVGSDQPFYLACGFRKLFDSVAWFKTYEPA